MKSSIDQGFQPPNLFFRYLQFLIVPVMLVGYIGTPIATVWLLFVGEWKTVLLAIVVGVFATFVLPFLLLPVAIFFVKVHESGSFQARSNVATLFGWVYMIILSIIVPLSILFVLLRLSDPTNSLLASIMSFGVAVFPFMRLTKMASENSLATDEMFNTFFIQLAFITSIVCVYVGMPFFTMAVLFAAIQLILSLLYLIVNWNRGRSHLRH
jgi:hypothetical protein